MSRPVATESIDRRIATSFVVLLALVMTFVLVAASVYYVRVTQAEREKLVMLVGDTLRGAIEGVQFSGKYRARLVVEDLVRENPPLAYISIVSPDGVVMAHSDESRNDGAADVDGLDAVMEVARTGQRRLVERTVEDSHVTEIIEPLAGGYGGDTVAVIRIGLHTETLFDTLVRGVVPIGALLLATVLACVPVARAMSRRLGAPVAHQAQELRGILARTPLLIAMIDDEGRVVRASGEFYQRLGIDPLERPLLAGLLPVPPRPALDGAGRQLTVRVGAEDATLYVTHFPVVTRADGTVVLSCLMAADLTEQQRAAAERARLEDQLRESQKLEALGRLAGGIAHDFNNLLTVITGRAEMMRFRTPDDSPEAAELDTIYGAAMRAADLTHKLLAISRRQVGRSGVPEAACRGRRGGGIPAPAKKGTARGPKVFEHWVAGSAPRCATAVRPRASARLPSDYRSPMDDHGFHMTPEEFRRRGHEVVDWIASYLEDIERFPVLSRAMPGEVRAALPEHPPEQGEPFAAVMADLDQVILPGITHWQAPGFFAYFNANSSGPAILGELLSAGLGVQGMLWSTSPAATELETLVMDWMVDLLGLPGGFRSDGPGGGVIEDSASSATLCALLAARERGARDRQVVYASTEAHSSVDKGVRIAGIPHLRKVGTDARRALDPAALRAAITLDLQRGLVPTAVIATVGTTSSHAVDPVRAVGEIAREHGAWLHVDAAHAGTAALLAEHRWIHDGLELADSYCTNPHKWMFTNFDLDAFFVRDRRALTAALSILPEYLRNQATASGAVIDYRDWQVPLGRRFRALKLWLVIRHYGAAGLRHHVAEHIRLAALLEQWIAQAPDWELAAPRPLNLVCFRHKGGDAVNQRIMDEVNASGELFLTHTRLDERLVLRLCVGGTWTRERHVRAAWERLQAAGGRA